MATHYAAVNEINCLC